MAVADLAPGQHATSARNHWWWRPGWRVGRRFYAFHCTFEDQPDLYHHIAFYRRALRTVPAISLIPDRWLHLTLQGVGFCDEISAPTLSAVTRQVTTALHRTTLVDATTAGVVVADEAVAVPLVPPEPIQSLRTDIRTALSRVLGGDQVPDHPRKYRPHISLGYTTATGSTEPYLAALHDIDPTPVTIRIKEVSLIKMHRDRQMYEWETVDRIRLRGTHWGAWSAR